MINVCVLAGWETGTMKDTEGAMTKSLACHEIMGGGGGDTHEAQRG